MDRRFVCTVLAVLAVTAGTAALVERTELPQDAPLYHEVSGLEREQPPQEPSRSEKQPEYAYIIREYEGRVAVFSYADDVSPEMILDTPVRFLPDYDRNELKDGVKVKDYRELLARIEDYIS